MSDSKSSQVDHLIYLPESQLSWISELRPIPYLEHSQRVLQVGYAA